MHGIFPGKFNQFGKKSDNVILFDNEYGSNYIALLKKLKIKICSLKNGDFLRDRIVEES